MSRVTVWYMGVLKSSESLFIVVSSEQIPRRGRNRDATEG
jgi:hypothetical protein